MSFSFLHLFRKYEFSQGVANTSFTRFPNRFLASQSFASFAMFSQWAVCWSLRSGALLLSSRTRSRSRPEFGQAKFSSLVKRKSTRFRFKDFKILGQQLLLALLPISLSERGPEAPFSLHFLHPFTFTFLNKNSKFCLLLERAFELHSDQLVYGLLSVLGDKIPVLCLGSKIFLSRTYLLANLQGLMHRTCFFYFLSSSSSQVMILHVFINGKTSLMCKF